MTDLPDTVAPPLEGRILLPPGPDDLWRSFRSGWLRPLILGAMLAAVSALWSIQLQPPRYEARAVLLFQPDAATEEVNIGSEAAALSTERLARLAVEGGGLTQDDALTAKAPLLAGFPFADRLATAFAPDGSAEVSAALALMDRATVAADKDARTLTLTVIGTTPARARSYAEALLSAYLADLEDRRARASEARADWLARRLAVLEGAVHDGESRLAALGMTGSDADRAEALQELEASRALHRAALLRWQDLATLPDAPPASVETLEPPRPGRWVGPPHLRITLSGGVLGLLLGSLWLIVRDRMRPTVDTAEDLAAMTGLRILGEVPRNGGFRRTRQPSSHALRPLRPFLSRTDRAGPDIIGLVSDSAHARQTGYCQEVARALSRSQRVLLIMATAQSAPRGLPRGLVPLDPALVAAGAAPPRVSTGLDVWDVGEGDPAVVALALRRLKREYGTIIVCLPAPGEQLQPSIWPGLCDSILFCGLAGRSTKWGAESAVEELRRLGKAPEGAILLDGAGPFRGGSRPLSPTVLRQGNAG